MRTRTLFSPSWYRVAELRPRLSAHAGIHRQQLRGRTWYILEDRVGQRFHRFSPAAHLLIGLMDGRRTVQQLWDTTCARLGDDAPTQDDVISLLSQLHAADVLQTAQSPDTDELMDRGRRRRRQGVLNQLSSFLSWRIPLLDPERMLQRVLPVLGPLVGWLGALLWVAVVAPAAVLLAMHWRDLTHGAMDQLMSVQNLAAFWVLMFVLKALHEVGHAVVTKAYGGEVHDMGLMLLVFHPVPYVDASSAWKFPDKWQRIVVGAAGMLVELFLAAVATLVWLHVEPGLVRTLAFDTIVIAGVSTVLFNANPLLRFDGYYMLSDWLEIPNLRPRSGRYLGHLAERYLFGSDAPRPVTAPGEAAWLVTYACGSFMYRVLVIAVLLIALGHRHLYLAVLVGGGAAVSWLGVPLGKGVGHLCASPRLRAVRARALAVSLAMVAVPIALVTLVPVPYVTRAEGVIWLPEEALVRAGVDGFVETIPARAGQHVRRGQPLLTLRDETLTTRVAELAAQRRELAARRDVYLTGDLVKAQMVADELAYVDRDLAEARRRTADLTVTAAREGTFVVAVHEDLPQRFVKRGELIGYVMDGERIILRAVVSQADIDLVRHQTAAVLVRLVERPGDSVAGVVHRMVPAATEHLPATALGAGGGGKVTVDLRDARGTKTVERLFQVDVELPLRPRHVNVGGRAYLRFDHGRAPFAQQWYRHLRQLCLSVFDA